MYTKNYFIFDVTLKFKINLFLFIISIKILLIRERLIIIIISWDLLGITSFFLILYYNNLDSFLSSLVTFFFNRLGDRFIIMIFSILIINIINLNNLNYKILLWIYLFICVITKRAQLPFGVWLPIAISAPTPISSLVHSSTLVTAGLFILMKVENFILIKEIKILILTFGIATFLFSGVFRLIILDIKKAVAFSTFSQLGFIIVTLIIEKFIITFLHLRFHAIFKSLLFIRVGKIIIINFSIQDIRMFKKNYFNNLIFIPFVISLIRLIGIVSTIGFISKDLILINLFLYKYKILLNFFIYLGCLITICYSIKFFIFLIVKRIISSKLNKTIKINIYFFKLIFLTFFCVSANIFFLELGNISIDNYINKDSKILFYIIIIFSLIIYKIFYKLMKNYIFTFSAIFYFFDIFINLRKNLNKTLKNFSIKIIYIEEYTQMYIFKKLINSKLND